MDKSEFATFASAIRTYYPKETILPNEQAMTLWYLQLSDIPYKVASVFLQKWVSVNKWSPSIADIRAGVTDLTGGDFKEWGDAWQEVLKAISKYGSYREEEAIASLDPTTQKVVRQLGFKNICFSEDIQIDRANFRMIYENQIERDKQAAQIPPQLQKLIENIAIESERGRELEKQV